VSSWKNGRIGDHVVRVFEGSGAMWTALRVLAGGFGCPGSAFGQLDGPCTLRLCGDCTLAVVDRWNDRVSLFRVEDGSFVRHVAARLSGPYDVEECESGWLVSCAYSNAVELVTGVVESVGGGGVGRASRARLGRGGSGDGEFKCPSALALVPGLGLVVREAGNSGRLQFFATPDAMSMASMSAARVGWMVGVARGLLVACRTMLSSPGDGAVWAGRS
jgi:hypothetical protein